MSLAPGTKLGPYDITAPIGEGGMGQVWRATDTTLGRQVAIKVLPAAFASDPERLARFEREAKTLASLNHPHIAAIWSPDGDTLAVERLNLATYADVFLLPLAGADRAARLLVPHQNTFQVEAQYSPDGRYVAFASGSGRRAVLPPSGHAHHDARPRLHQRRTRRRHARAPVRSLRIYGLRHRLAARVVRRHRRRPAVPHAPAPSRTPRPRRRNSSSSRTGSRNSSDWCR